MVENLRVIFSDSQECTLNNLESIKDILSEVRTDEKSHFKLTSGFVQHGNTSVMKHCISVACVSLIIAGALHIKVDKRALVRGALLHDYFLYDWHEKRAGHGLHGFRHPYAALRNASRDFNLSSIEENVILRHMFPLTPIPPGCREAWIVCMADKYCSTRETLYTVRRYAKSAYQFVFG